MVVLIILAFSATQAGAPAFAQEKAKAPAAEQSDEFQKAFDGANALLREGRIGEAITEFRRAAAFRDGKCAECFQLIGQIYQRVGMLKEAATALRQCVELKPPNEAAIYNLLGVTLYLQNEPKSFEEAVVALQRAIELSQGKITTVYFNLGFALIKAGKEQDGISALKTFISVDPEASQVAQARAVIANTKLVDAKIAPSFTVKSHVGADLSLEKLRGKIVLLDFWASWCGPCRFDMPEVRKIWKKYAGDQFVVIGVNLDSNQSKFEAYMKEQEITWPQYYDGLGWGNKISRLYEVYSIPHTVLVDQEGVIRATGLRGEELAEKIADLLRKLNGSGSK